jgi:hypothetical protein
MESLLDDPLGLPVGAFWRRRTVFIDRRDDLIPIHGSRRRKDESTDTTSLKPSDQGERRAHVIHEELFRVRHGQGGLNSAGEMHTRINWTYLVDKRLVATVTLDENGAVWHIFATTLRKVVEGQHFMTTFQEELRRCGADEPRGARDKNSHFRHSPWRQRYSGCLQHWSVHGHPARHIVPHASGRCPSRQCGTVLPRPREPAFRRRRWYSRAVTKCAEVWQLI